MKPSFWASPGAVSSLKIGPHSWKTVELSRRGRGEGEKKGRKFRLEKS